MTKPRALVACAGFGLVSLALREFGYDVTGIELDDAIASVNRANGGDCITADFTTVDPRQFGEIELFQVSPPCQNHSQAKAHAAESPLDIALARQTCRYIRTLKPKFFLLENVWLYRQSESWRLILHCLKRTGYKVGFWRLCAADYSTPQTRHRMIVVARRDGVRPHKPFPTHAKTPDLFCQRWNGWLSAIEDLVPYLPDSEFADWHKARMPAELLESILIGGGNTNIAQPTGKPRSADEPAFTVFASTGYFRERAFIVSNFDMSRDATIRQADEPIWTVRANEFRRPASVARAFIGDFRHAVRDATIRFDDEPLWAVQASGIQRQSWVKATVCGRTVSMTPRCYARWQDLPDSFILPASNELACRGIGNGVPLNLTRAVMRTLAAAPCGVGR